MKKLAFALGVTSCLVDVSLVYAKNIVEDRSPFTALRGPKKEKTLAASFKDAPPKISSLLQRREQQSLDLLGLTIKATPQSLILRRPGTFFLTKPQQNLQNPSLLFQNLLLRKGRPLSLLNPAKVLPSLSDRRVPPVTFTSRSPAFNLTPPQSPVLRKAIVGPTQPSPSLEKVVSALVQPLPSSLRARPPVKANLPAVESSLKEAVSGLAQLLPSTPSLPTQSLAKTNLLPPAPSLKEAVAGLAQLLPSTPSLPTQSLAKPNLLPPAPSLKEAVAGLNQLDSSSLPNEPGTHQPQKVNTKEALHAFKNSSESSLVSPTPHERQISEGPVLASPTLESLRTSETTLLSQHQKQEIKQTLLQDSPKERAHSTSERLLEEILPVVSSRTPSPLQDESRPLSLKQNSELESASLDQSFSREDSRHSVLSGLHLLDEQKAHQLGEAFLKRRHESPDVFSLSPIPSEREGISHVTSPHVTSHAPVDQRSLSATLTESQSPSKDRLKEERARTIHEPLRVLSEQNPEQLEEAFSTKNSSKPIQVSQFHTMEQLQSFAPSMETRVNEEHPHEEHVHDAQMQKPLLQERHPVEEHLSEEQANSRSHESLQDQVLQNRSNDEFVSEVHPLSLSVRIPRTPYDSTLPYIFENRQRVQKTLEDLVNVARSFHNAPSIFPHIEQHQLVPVVNSQSLGMSTPDTAFKATGVSMVLDLAALGMNIPGMPSVVTLSVDFDSLKEVPAQAQSLLNFGELEERASLVPSSRSRALGRRVPQKMYTLEVTFAALDVEPQTMHFTLNAQALARFASLVQVPVSSDMETLESTGTLVTQNALQPQDNLALLRQLMTLVQTSFPQEESHQPLLLSRNASNRLLIEDLQSSVPFTLGKTIERSPRIAPQISPIVVNTTWAEIPSHVSFSMGGSRQPLLVTPHDDNASAIPLVVALQRPVSFSTQKMLRTNIPPQVSSVVVKSTLGKPQASEQRVHPSPLMASRVPSSFTQSRPVTVSPSQNRALNSLEIEQNSQVSVKEISVVPVESTGIPSFVSLFDQQRVSSQSQRLATQAFSEGSESVMRLIVDLKAFGITVPSRGPQFFTLSLDPSSIKTARNARAPWSLESGDVMPRDSRGLLLKSGLNVGAQGRTYTFDLTFSAPGFKPRTVTMTLDSQTLQGLASFMAGPSSLSTSEFIQESSLIPQLGNTMQTPQAFFGRFLSALSQGTSSVISTRAASSFPSMKDVAAFFRRASAHPITHHSLLESFFNLRGKSVSGPSTALVRRGQTQPLLSLTHQTDEVVSFVSLPPYELISDMLSATTDHLTRVSKPSVQPRMISSLPLLQELIVSPERPLSSHVDTPQALILDLAALNLGERGALSVTSAALKNATPNKDGTYTVEVALDEHPVTLPLTQEVVQELTVLANVSLPEDETSIPRSLSLIPQDEDPTSEKSLQQTRDSQDTFEGMFPLVRPSSLFSLFGNEGTWTEDELSAPTEPEEEKDSGFTLRTRLPSSPLLSSQRSLRRQALNFGSPLSVQLERAATNTTPVRRLPQPVIREIDDVTFILPETPTRTPSSPLSTDESPTNFRQAMTPPSERSSPSSSPFSPSTPISPRTLMELREAIEQMLKSVKNPQQQATSPSRSLNVSQRSGSEGSPSNFQRASTPLSQGSPSNFERAPTPLSDKGSPSNFERAPTPLSDKGSPSNFQRALTPLSQGSPSNFERAPTPLSDKGSPSNFQQALTPLSQGSPSIVSLEGNLGQQQKPSKSPSSRVTPKKATPKKGSSDKVSPKKVSSSPLRNIMNARQVTPQATAEPKTKVKTPEKRKITNQENVPPQTSDTVETF